MKISLFDYNLSDCRSANNSFNVNFFQTYQVDEGKVSRAPKSGADYEQSECSIDPKKRHLRVRYQTYTATKIRIKKKTRMTSKIFTKQFSKLAVFVAVYLLYA